MITKENADIISDYAGNLPKEMFNIHTQIVNAIDELHLNNLGKVYDHLENAKTIICLLESNCPVGFRYLDALLNIKKGT